MKDSTSSAFCRSGWAIRWNGSFISGAFAVRVLPELRCIIPLVFRTRKAARKYIAEGYSYIREREDLRRPPHSWRMPTVAKITLTVKEDA